MNSSVTTAGALALLIAATACNSGREPDNGANAVANGAASPAAVQTAAPATPGPNASEAEVRIFLASIYAPYATDRLGGADYETILEPQLAAAIASTEGGPGADPFIDAQDWVPFEPTYENIQLRGDRATATVRFNNGGAQTRIDYQLVRTSAGWRAYDVESADGGSLRERFMRGVRP